MLQLIPSPINDYYFGVSRDAYHSANIQVVTQERQWFWTFDSMLFEYLPWTNYNPAISLTTKNEHHVFTRPLPIVQFIKDTSLPCTVFDPTSIVTSNKYTE